MKARTAALITLTVLVALTMLVRLVAQEPQTESATTVTANPVPLINQRLVPDAINHGEAGFTLTVNGTGFVSSSVVKWNGSPRTTIFVSKSQLKASILSSEHYRHQFLQGFFVTLAPSLKKTGYVLRRWRPHKLRRLCNLTVTARAYHSPYSS
jgi:IPT/TIG domain